MKMVLVNSNEIFWGGLIETKNFQIFGTSNDHILCSGNTNRIRLSVNDRQGSY